MRTTRASGSFRDARFAFVLAVQSETVDRRVRDLADRGTPLHRIAVIARQARPYVDLALAALERFGVPATARRRVAWSEIPVIRAVRSLLAAAAEGWTRHGLAELAEQPYFRNELDVRLVNYAGFRRRLHGLDAWRSALQGIAQEAAAHEEREARGEESDERRAPLPPAARAREAADGFAAFAGRAAELDPPRTLNRWLAWLGDFLHADPWGMERRIWRVPASRYDIARLDLAGWRGLTRLVDGWCGALATPSRPPASRWPKPAGGDRRPGRLGHQSPRRRWPLGTAARSVNT